MAVVLACGAALAFGLALFMGEMGAQAQRSAADRAYMHSIGVIDAARAVFGSVQSMETGQRGYLLARDDTYLEPFRSAVVRVDGEVQALAALVSDNAVQVASVQRLATLVGIKRTELEGTITLQQGGRTREALEVVRGGQGRITMDEIRGVIDDVIAEESRLLAELGRKRDRAAFWSKLLANVAALVSGVLVALAAVASLVAMRAGARAAAERERLRVAAQLIATERNFGAMADTMPNIVWSAAADGTFDFFNRRWAEYSGAADTREAWFDHMHEEDRGVVEGKWRESLANGAPFEAECRFRGADGAWRWFLCRAQPALSADGTVEKWFGACTDIHDARTALEARDLLSQELGHRIKNIFAVVSSLVQLSARANPAQRDFAETLRDRIGALGRAYDFVRPSDAADGAARPRTFKAFVLALLDAHAGDAPDRIAVSGDDITLSDAAAGSLALIFHELATNAVKYGALSTPEGRITITCTRVGEVFTATWREFGGPGVAGPPSREGFGAKLARVSVEGQLGGRLFNEWRADGLVVRVELPTRHVEGV
ncbi:MAG: CHASE3 domain-containing protein [Hyphomonadaceae bacterium]|nr:CHASE3 domain-containing protein [Hyphomonadaceae bacterium]